MRNNNYEIIEEKQLTDIDSKGTLLRHKKSGARIFLVSNEDDNKVFSIAFRTPPSDSTGVPHIMEHSVLCGSKKFPAKDPFVELAKGSLNTFLNAMTYSDKTVYPVASCNEKDFKNLMHVYLDAVFYPNIYERKEIFMQEGWHYELEEPDGELTINGVVYNEMKGVFSSPEDVLERMILNSLYPDNAYAFESGGDPDDIPSLTYEQFLDFHRTYYHPSNSYIFLYGDCDMEERLEFLDKEYLSHFDRITVDSEISRQTPFEQPVEVRKEYSVASDDTTENKTYLSYNVSIADCLDRELYLAIQVLDYALLSAPGAPLKQAILDAGIGNDVMSSYDNGVLQPYFSVIVKNSEESKKEAFVKLVRETLEQIKENGIDKRSLQAALNVLEFRYREADFGRFPIGLSYGLTCMDSWLYDETQPFVHLEENEIFARLKERIDSDYFETLIEKYLIHNPHASVVIVAPKAGLTTESEQVLAKKLAAYKESLSEEAVAQLVADTKHLKEYQQEPSTQEELATIPLLSISDIKKEAKPFQNESRTKDGVHYLFHPMKTKGIAYVDLMFETDCVKAEELPYLSLLRYVLGYVDTTKHSFSELSNELNIHTGSTYASVMHFHPVDDPKASSMHFVIHTKVLYEEMCPAMELITEMICDSRIEDDKRLYEIMARLKSRLQMDMSSNGHSTAYARAASYFSESACISEALSGIEFYRVVDRLESHFEEEKEALKEKLKELVRRIFCVEKLTVSLTSDEEGYELVTAQMPVLTESIRVDAAPAAELKFDLKVKNEGFKDASKVQYVARAGNFTKQAGLPYTGTLKILRTILSYDYMWLQIRVKGGAYGCMSGFDRSGDSYFVSYRDPNLDRTMEVYEQVPDYVRNFAADEREMTKYIIGTISALDTPLNPAAAGARSLTAWMSKITFDQIQKERDEILSADEEAIRALVPYMEAILSAQCLCVIGNEEKINENKEMFLDIEKLL